MLTTADKFGPLLSIYNINLGVMRRFISNFDREKCFVVCGLQPNFLAERDKKSFGSCDARRPQKLGSATENYEATMQPRNWPWGNATDLEAGKEFLGGL